MAMSNSQMVLFKKAWDARFDVLVPFVGYTVYDIYEYIRYIRILYTNIHMVFKVFWTILPCRFFGLQTIPWSESREAPEALNTLELPVPRNTVGSLVELAWKAPKSGWGQRVNFWNQKHPGHWSFLRRQPQRRVRVGGVSVRQSMRFALTFSAGIRPEFFWGFRKCIKGCSIYSVGEHVCIKARSNIFDTRRLLWEPCPRQMHCNQSTSTQLYMYFAVEIEVSQDFLATSFPSNSGMSQQKYTKMIKNAMSLNPSAAHLFLTSTKQPVFEVTTAGDSDQRAGLPRQSSQQLGSVVSIDWDITYDITYDITPPAIAI